MTDRLHDIEARLADTQRRLAEAEHVVVVGLSDYPLEVVRQAERDVFRLGREADLLAELRAAHTTNERLTEANKKLSALTAVPAPPEPRQLKATGDEPQHVVNSGAEDWFDIPAASPVTETEEQ